MKVAVIGTGIAGNVAAYHLRKQHNITVYERNGYIGGHSNTLKVETGEQPVNLDTGFMVYNNRTYPEFRKLLDELGIESQDSNMSFSVHCESTGLEYNGSSLNSLFAQRRNLARPGFYRMIRDILRFNDNATRFLLDGSSDPTLAEFLAQGNYCRQFMEQYLFPMGAAIWSADMHQMENMPARFFVRFFQNHGLLDLSNRPTWKVIKDGSQAYVQRLVTGHRDKIRLNSEVQWIRRMPNQVLVKVAGSEAELYDFVFIACHSDQALGMLEDPLPVERQVLGAIPYQRNQVTLHTDQTLMPKRRAAWAAWNYHISGGSADRVSVTYHLNRLQGLTTRQQFFVTLNCDNRIATEKVLSRLEYTHPVFNTESVAAQSRHRELNGSNRTYYCGAYWRNGFHEDGVVSALQALEHFASRESNAERNFQRAS